MLITITFFLLLVGLPNDHSPSVASLCTQEACTAIDFDPITIIKRPTPMEYTEGSTGNYLGWTVSYFNNYTVQFNWEIVAQGGQQSAGRVNITKGQNIQVTVNVDGLDPRTHTISLTVSTSAKYLCGPQYCSCGGANRFASDTTTVLVQPKPVVYTPEFSAVEGVFAMTCLVGGVYGKKFYRKKKDNS